MKKLLLLIFVRFSVGFSAELPKDLKWITNEEDAIFSDPAAKKGGTLHTFALEFPPTFRIVGPDATNSFRNHFLDNLLSLIDVHPNTDKIIPLLATHWAYGKDRKSMYFKINPKAKWSDGEPVTADDFLFTLEFMRSPNIIDPWYNEYYTKEISDVQKFDGHTIGVFSTIERPLPNIHLHLSLHATPKHFFKGLIPKDFVTKYNWEVMPVTGAYKISDFKKGKSITFNHVKDWWAGDLKYLKNRFNVDNIEVQVIRDINVAWEYFKNNKIDLFPLANPTYWYDKSKTAIFENGYAEKLWFYTDNPQSPMGLYLNEKHPVLKDINVRLGIAHAMNIQKIIDNLLHGDFKRLDQMFVGYGEYSDKTIKARAFNLDESKKYFDKAGFKTFGSDGIRTKGDQRLSFKINYGSDLYTPRFVILKEEAKKSGLELVLQLVDSSANYKIGQEKKHEIIFWGWSTGMRPDYYQLIHSDFANTKNNNNLSATDDKDIDELVDRHKKLLEEKDIIAVGKTIQQKIHNRAFFIPFFSVPYVREGFYTWIKHPKIAGTKHSDNIVSDHMKTESDGLFWIDADEEKRVKKLMEAQTPGKPITVIDKTYLSNH